jgi:hypothetical protein
MDTKALASPASASCAALVLASLVVVGTVPSNGPADPSTSSRNGAPFASVRGAAAPSFAPGVACDVDEPDPHATANSTETATA